MKRFLIILLASLVSASNLFSQKEGDDLFKITQTFNYLKDNYVDTFDTHKIAEKMIIAGLKELDPHSSYYNKDEVTELEKGLKGSFDGIGITYNILDDTLLILSTFANGPSDKAGIKAGDRIVFVEGKNIAGVKITKKEIKQSFLGKRGTDVKIKVKRRNQDSLLNFSITRDKIDVKSIDASYMATPKVGYIRLRRFSSKSSKEIKKACKELEGQGAENLIIDLQNNGGGYLSSAVTISDYFLKKNKLITYTEGNKRSKRNYFSTKDILFKKGRIVVLINENTASASEILSGAIQDWDRGVIIGRRSYGKGLVQQPYYLNDGSMVRVTIARYYTPSGRSIQKPYIKGKKDEYLKELSHRSESGELYNADSLRIDSLPKYKTMEKQRTVYGGGGIFPDITIVIDTTKYTTFYRNLMRSGNLFSFVHHYVDENRKYFNSKFQDFQGFKDKYIVDEKVIKELYEYASQKKDITENADSLIQDMCNKPVIKTHLKALIANDLWSENEFYKIQNSISDIFLKAVEVISDEKAYNSFLN